jgi:hypothetical protein
MTPALLAPLALPPAVQKWLLDFWVVIQGLDDWRDNDPVDAKEKERVIYLVMVEIPQNPFFSSALAQPAANHQQFDFAVDRCEQVGG